MDEVPDKRISTVVIPTCGRPATLGRALCSYIDNGNRHKRRLRCLIADDAITPTDQQETLTTLKDVKRKYGARVTLEYIGTAQREAFALQLSSLAGVKLEVCRTAITSSSPGVFGAGACRNVLQLATVDELVLSADDDTICAGTTAGERHPSLRIAPDRDPAYIRSFDSFASAVAATTQDREGDVLLSHEHVLGHTLRDVMGPGRAAGDLSLIDHTAQCSSRIRASISSLIGDCGIASDWDLFRVISRGGGRDKNHGWSTVKTRQIIRSVDVVTIVPTSFIPGWTLAFDNFGYLPPFPPFSRGEDVVFGTLLRACDSSSLVAFLPALIHHRPTAERVTSQDRIQLASTRVAFHEFCHWVIGAMRRKRCSEAPHNHLEDVSRRLRDLSCMSPSEFECFFQSLRSNILQHRLRAIEEWFAKGPEPWICDLLDRCAESIRMAVQAPLESSHAQLAEDDENCSSSSARGTMGQFAEIILAWPGMREAARQLKQDGAKCARTIEA